MKSRARSAPRRPSHCAHAPRPHLTASTMPGPSVCKICWPSRLPEFGVDVTLLREAASFPAGAPEQRRWSICRCGPDSMCAQHGDWRRWCAGKLRPHPHPHAAHCFGGQDGRDASPACRWCIMCTATRPSKWAADGWPGSRPKLGAPLDLPLRRSHCGFPDAADYIHHWGVPEERIHFVPNGVPDRAIVDRPTPRGDWTLASSRCSARAKAWKCCWKRWPC